jgi:hypothetical protein
VNQENSIQAVSATLLASGESTKWRTQIFITNGLHPALHNNEKGNANPRMQHVEEKILAVNVIDVAIVRISPPCRPWIDEFKGVATVLEARLAGYDYASGTKVVALRAGQRDEHFSSAAQDDPAPHARALLVARDVPADSASPAHVIDLERAGCPDVLRAWAVRFLPGAPVWLRPV